ncbi:MAG: major facilitator superfamily 1 [Microbacteriaceae bacterium]|nr:major facilitator superfamily 1 [Microbacteriaceae bacterium]
MHRKPAPSLAALNAAGFVTAFGAHSIAAGLGVESRDIGLNLLTFGVLLAVYDLAEVILKPVFGSLSDRIGVKPVIVGGLIGFAMMSLLGIFAGSPILLGLARFGQGAAASAFSPASSCAVARLAGPAAAGRHFGRYGSWKGLGYALGPLIGAGLIWLGGFPALFIALAVSAAATACWVMISVPDVSVLARPRYTVADLARQLTDRGFLVPVAALAVATGALGVAVGFLPLLGTNLGLNPLASIATVTIMAIASSLVQPFIGRLRDSGKITTRPGMASGILVIALAVALVAIVPSPAVLYLAALCLGLGIGTSTALGFAHLAATIPPERMGRTMGTAELGREVGDAGGPLLVGAVATAAGLATGLGALAVVAGIVGILCAIALPSRARIVQ